MKRFKSITAAYFIIGSVLTSSLAFSSDQPSPETSPVPATFALNPDSIRHQLQESNLTIQQTVMHVHEAKDSLSLARDNLLPSLNVAGLLTLTGGINFALSTVSALLPFLLPSNWFKAADAKDLYESELLAYKIVELNTYSSALAMYFTVLSDFDNQKYIEQEAADYDQIYKSQNSEYLLTGIGSTGDIERAHSQALTAQVRAEQIAAALDNEVPAMRTAMGLTLATKLTFDGAAMPASEYENSDIQVALDQALKIAPEHEQIQFMISAAENEKWASVFSFMTGATVSASSSGGFSSTPTSVSFSNLRAGYSTTLGVAQIPQISLSNRNIEEVKTHETALRQQTSQVLEGNINSLKEVKKQLDNATQAEIELHRVYAAELQKYQWGLSTLTDVLTARTQLATASSLRVSATLALNLIRITLHRTMITDQFAQIKGCAVVDQAETVNEGGGGIFGWIGRLFKGGESHDFLDQVCRAH